MTPIQNDQPNSQGQPLARTLAFAIACAAGASAIFAFVVNYPAYVMPLAFFGVAVDQLFRALKRRLNSADIVNPWLIPSYVPLDFLTQLDEAIDSGEPMEIPVRADIGVRRLVRIHYYDPRGVHAYDRVARQGVAHQWRELDFRQRAPDGGERGSVP